MNLKLEVVIVPVSDVDRAKKFYVEKLGFRVDVDNSSDVQFFAWQPAAPKYRVIQLTPPGSECSIHIGEGLTQVKPGSLQHFYLVTSDLEATRTELIKRGVDLSEPFHFSPNEGKTPGLHPERADYNSFVGFSDPDGNSWVIQEVKKRAPGR
jgi:catechol 2,3-dioxygenase-like lactoylglutathione lyase family enzyme